MPGAGVADKKKDERGSEGETGKSTGTTGKTDDGGIDSGKKDTSQR